MSSSGIGAGNKAGYELSLLCNYDVCTIYVLCIYNTDTNRYTNNTILCLINTGHNLSHWSFGRLFHWIHTLKIFLK